MGMKAHSCALASAAIVSLAACSSPSDGLEPPADQGTTTSPSDDASTGSGQGSGSDAAVAVTSVPDAAVTTVGPGAGDVDAAPHDASTAPHDGATASPDASPIAVKDAGVAGDAGAGPYKGVANAACNDLVTLGASWYYNWTLSPGSCTASSFVPMVWGHTGAEQTAAGIASEIKGITSAGYNTVLGFNEPDNTTQSNISVATAISLWPSLTQSSLRVGSPATQGNATGLTWFTSFMNEVNADTTGTLRVDFITAHWYGWNAGSCDAAAANLESYLKQIEAIPGNRPIWLTEWGCLNLSNPTEAVVQAFFTGAVAMFKKHPRLERYGWYQWTTNNELVDTADASDTLTSLGIAFQAAPATM